MIGTLFGDLVFNFFSAIWLFLLSTKDKISNGKKIVTCILTFFAMEAVCLLLLFLPLSNNYFRIIGYCLVCFVYITVETYVLSLNKSLGTMISKTVFCVWVYEQLLASVVCNTTLFSENNITVAVIAGLNILFVAFYTIVLQGKVKAIDNSQTFSRLFFEVVTILLIVFALSLMCIDMEHGYVSNQTSASMIIAIPLVICFYYLLYTSSVKNSLDSNYKQMKLKNEIYEEMIRNSDEIENNNRKIRHDFRHHNLVILEYAKDNNCEAIVDYLKEYDTSVVNSNPDRLAANRTLNNILSAYARKAEKYSIDYKCEVSAPKDLEITDVDLVSILANILDNATKSCLLVKNNRFINIAIKQTGSKLVIKCANTLGEEVHFEDGLPRSNVHEGFGIQSIVTTSKKYKGMCDFTCENGTFYTDVILNNNVNGKL